MDTAYCQFAEPAASPTLGTSGALIIAVRMEWTAAGLRLVVVRKRKLLPLAVTHASVKAYVGMHRNSVIGQGACACGAGRMLRSAAMLPEEGKESWAGRGARHLDRDLCCGGDRGLSDYGSFANSVLAFMRMGRSGSAVFQRARKST
jgi:hypothetical protein